MKKYLVIISIGLVIVFAVFMQRGSIAQKLLPKAVEQALSSDISQHLADGLHITLCGAGGPMPSANRSGPCVAVLAGDKLFIVDAGTNGVRNLGRLRYPIGKIAGVFLTHFHSDHIDGLGELATLRWVQGNHQTPLTIYGPEGLSQIVEGFNLAYGLDSIYRNKHHGDSVAPLSGRGMIAKPYPIPPQGQTTTLISTDELSVKMLAVNHHPVAPAVAYLFKYRDRSVLISGDTSKSANLEQFASGVDLLVHEALAPNLINIMKRGAASTGNTSLAKIMADVLNYHASPVDAAEIARDADVGHLLYYHIVPPLVLPGTEAAWLEGVDSIFSQYTLGTDGTSFSLPANSTEIVKTRSSL